MLAECCSTVMVIAVCGEINMYLLMWLYWISPKLLMLFLTDVC